MIRVTIRVALLLAACVLLLSHPADVVDFIRVAAAAVQSQPEEYLSLFACVLLVSAVIWWVARLLFWRPRSTTHAPVGAIARMTPSQKAGHPHLARTSRHEAAHAVAALKLGMSDISANVHVIGSRAGRVEFSCNESIPLEESLFDQLVFGIAGQIADHNGGFFDYGSVNDLEMQQGRVFHLLSIGRSPSRLKGELSTDSLISSARAEATQLLEEHAQLVNRIAEALCQKQQLDDAELRDLAAMTYTAKPVNENDAGALTHRAMTVP